MTKKILEVAARISSTVCIIHGEEKGIVEIERWKGKREKVLGISWIKTSPTLNKLSCGTYWEQAVRSSDGIDRCLAGVAQSFFRTQRLFC